MAGSVNINHYCVAIRRMAEIISNSAILTTVRPQRHAYGGGQIRPRARKMADFTANSAILDRVGSVVVYVGGQGAGVDVDAGWTSASVGAFCWLGS